MKPPRQSKVDHFVEPRWQLFPFLIQLGSKKQLQPTYTNTTTSIVLSPADTSFLFHYSWAVRGATLTALYKQASYFQVARTFQHHCTVIQGVKLRQVLLNSLFKFVIMDASSILPGGKKRQKMSEKACEFGLWSQVSSKLQEDTYSLLRIKKVIMVHFWWNFGIYEPTSNPFSV